MSLDPVIDPALVSIFDYSAMNAHLSVLGAVGAGKTTFVASRVSRGLFSSIGCEGHDERVRGGDVSSVVR